MRIANRINTKSLIATLGAVVLAGLLAGSAILQQKVYLSFLTMWESWFYAICVELARLYVVLISSRLRIRKQVKQARLNIGYSIAIVLYVIAEFAVHGDRSDPKTYAAYIMLGAAILGMSLITEIQIGKNLSDAAIERRRKEQAEKRAAQPKTKKKPKNGAKISMAAIEAAAAQLESEGKEASQAAIAQILNVNRSTVGRHIKKAGV